MIEKDENTLLEAVARLTPQWLAGFFDGEGCVSLKGTGNAGFDYALRVNITQADPVLLGLIAEKYHACGPYLKKHKKHVQEVFEINWTGHKALDFLNAVKDFVVVKKARVELALAFLAISPGSGNAITEDVLKQRLAMGEEMHVLNGSRIRTNSNKPQPICRTLEDIMLAKFSKLGLSEEMILNVLRAKGGVR